MKTTKTTFKLTALLLALAMLFCTIPFSAVALENDAATTESAQGISASPSQGESSAEEILGESAPKEALGLGELTTEVLATMEVNAEDIPEVIPMARAQEKGLVNRLYAQEESLSTVLFQTKSGNKTAYVFGKPVKYVDASGAVRDKSTAITGMLDITYAYAMLDNSVKVYFPRSITNGVMLSYNDYSITMKPEVSGSFTATYAEEENAVAYAGVFGSTSILTYTPTLYGVKEDIVLVKYEDENSFDFVLTLQGLTAAENESGIWELLDARGKAVANLGNVIVKDSAGKTAYGELNVVSLGNSQYRVTVTAPEEFLEAEDTVYPVYVDPTTTIYEEDIREFTDDEGYPSDEYVNTIIDVGLYQSSTDYNRAINSPTEHYLGEYVYNGRIIYKLYDFYGEHGWFTDLNADQIGKVTLYVTAFDYSEQTVSVNPMTDTWSSATYGEDPIALLEDQVSLWDEIHETYGVSSFNITGDCEHAIDITEIARNWADHNQGIISASYADPENGFCLNADDSIYSIIMATESTYIYDNVHYEVDYSIYGEPYYLVSKINEERYRSLQRSASGIPTVANFEAVANAKWNFEYLGTNSSGLERYYIRSAVNNAYLTVSGTTVTLSSSKTAAGVWILQPVTGGHRLKSEYSPSYVLNNNNGTLGVTANMSSNGTLWELLKTSGFVPLQSFVLDSEWLNTNETKHFGVIPTPANATHIMASHFTWSFTNSNFSVNNSGYVTAENYNGEFTYLTLTHKYTGKSATVWIGTPLETAGGVEDFGGSFNDKYLIRNLGLEKYFKGNGVGYTLSDIFAPTANAFWNILKTNDTKHFQFVVDGAWSAFSLTTATNDVIDTWRIGAVGEGEYYIFPDNNPNKVLGIDEEDNTLKLYSIGSADQHPCKWGFRTATDSVSIELFYDGDYLNQCGSNKTELFDRIIGHVERLQAFYAWEFGIIVHYDEDVKYLKTLTEKCDATLTGHCTHSDPHHDNCDNIIYDISMPASQKTVKMVFIGRRACNTDVCGTNKYVAGGVITWRRVGFVTYGLLQLQIKKKTESMLSVFYYAASPSSSIPVALIIFSIKIPYPSVGSATRT